MQVATLSYPHHSKDNFHSDSRSKFQRRHILTTVTNPQRKLKQPRAYQPDQSIHSNISLPAIKKSEKRPSSIRIKGNGLQSSKFNEASVSSFHQPPRSHSRQSEKSDRAGTRSRSITPSGTGRSTSKLVRLRFGYPVKMRSADFYRPDCPESELRFREESFVNDSIRTAHQRIRPSKTPHYEAFDDPNLQHFFQSPVVLDVVRKTLNIDLDARPSAAKKRSNRKDHDESYHRIVAKHSSGYGKLNGYDCLPPFAPSRQHRSVTHDRYQSSTNTSFTSFPTYNSLPSEQKKKTRPTKKSKQLAPIATSSPIRHPTAVTAETAPISNTSED